MLASYKVTRYVNLPDQVGVNTGKGLLMIDCEVNNEAYVGRELARYAGELKEKYDIEIIIWISGDEDYTIVARKNANDCDEEYDEEYDDYFDEDDELFYEENVGTDDVCNVLGKAFASIEKEVEPKKSCGDQKIEGTKDFKQKTSGSTDEFLRKLRNAINSIIEE